MLSKMYKLFPLFLLSNIQYAVSESKIDLYDMSIQQVEGTNHLEISFRVNGSIEVLNGHFSVVHKDCPAWSCGSTTVGIKGEGQKVTIAPPLAVQKLLWNCSECFQTFDWWTT